MTPISAPPAAPSRIQGLRCRECGTNTPLGAKYVCEECYGPLEVVYDYDVIRRMMTRETVEKGPRSIWRYLPLLPVSESCIVTLQEGCTPLVAAPRLGKELGLRNLWIKNDAVNPTYSFKDRVVACAVSRAKEFGFETISCASTGNLGCSVAAFGGVGGMRAVVFIPADLEPSKITGIGAYGPTLIAIDGNYDDVNRLCAEISATRPWAFVNINLRPFYSEGSKTLGFEVAEQLGWRAPDHVVVPIASGSLLCKVKKGLQELETLGLIGPVNTRFSGAQAVGCAPVASAFLENRDEIRPVRPETIAKSLAIGNPADGPYALDIIRKTGGGAAAVTDEEVIRGMKLLARTEGIFTETAGGVTVATVAALARSGKIGPDELTVAYITGNGYKTQEAIIPTLAKPPVIRASVAEVDRVLSGA
ncbi:MAG: threonine synthase [Candidatus Brocadiae bacterium]|nr:threonine synthase [Candidatus Brocadiia bacterium]